MEGAVRKSEHLCACGLIVRLPALLSFGDGNTVTTFDARTVTTAAK